MGFSEYLKELNELQPNYNNPPKELENPYIPILNMHVDGKSEDIAKVADIIKHKYNKIDQDTLAQVLNDNDLMPKNKQPNALVNLFISLRNIVRKY